MIYRRIPWTAVIMAACLFVLVAPSFAASVPAWLDEAITGWNEKNPDRMIRFVGIQDSFVWYRMQASEEIGQKEIRDVSDQLAQANGYVYVDTEEKVTTGRPPSESPARGDKKCWRRSMVLDAGGTPTGTTPTKQRMLTRMVCEDGAHWMTGFRSAE
jgi:hypothetical protein